MLAHIGSTRAKRIDLIEEKHARSIGARFFESAVQISFAVANPHVEHVVDSDGQKGSFDFTSGGARQISFSATGRAIHQNAAADFFPVSFVEVGMLDGRDDL